MMSAADGGDAGSDASGDALLGLLGKLGLPPPSGKVATYVTVTSTSTTQSVYQLEK